MKESREVLTDSKLLIKSELGFQVNITITQQSFKCPNKWYKMVWKLMILQNYNKTVKLCKHEMST